MPHSTSLLISDKLKPKAPPAKDVRLNIMFDNKFSLWFENPETLKLFFIIGLMNLLSFRYLSQCS